MKLWLIGHRTFQTPALQPLQRHPAAGLHGHGMNPTLYWVDRYKIRKDPPVRAFHLANAGGGGPVNLVFLGVTADVAKQRRDVTDKRQASA